MKAPLKIVKRLKTPSPHIEELKQAFHPIKQFYNVVQLVVFLVVGVWTLWPDFPTLTVVYATLFIALMLFLWRDHLVKVYRGDSSDWSMELIRQFLLILSAAASMILFLWAIFNENSPRLYLYPLAGAFGLLALQTAKAQLFAHKIEGVLPSMVGNLIEPLFIFAVIAGIYSIPALFLDHGLETGSITFRQLNRFGTFTHVGQRLLGHLHLSAVLAIVLTCLFFLGWLKRSWSRPQTPNPKHPWRIIHPGLKWPRRTVIGILFAAIFLSLAVHQYGSYVADGLPEFKNRYSRLQDRIEQPLERVIQRELIARTWTQLNERDREKISNSVRNRKAFKNLEQEYAALAALGSPDTQTETIISEMRAPVFSEESTNRLHGLAEEHFQLPKDLEDVPLSTLRISLVVNSDPEGSPVPNAAEEVNEMNSTVKSSILELTSENPQNQVRLYGWLNKHFSGLDEILNHIKDAEDEFLLQATKQAQGKVIDKKLASPLSKLDVLVTDEGRVAAARIPLHSIQLSDDYSNISAERDTIQRAKSSLRRQAPKAIKAALEMSKVRTEPMVKQIRMLDEQFPSLHLSTGGHVTVEPDFTYSVGFWTVAAHQRTKSQEAQLRSLENLKAIADTNSVTELIRQLQAEQGYESLLAELVGRESALRGFRSILGSNFDRYMKIYEDRRSELGYN